MKKYLVFVSIFFCSVSKAQSIDSIYVNLYTDSLKKGTYNYINIDGLLSNGTYLPLDSTQLIFKASAGQFFGNSLLVDKDFKGEKITIEVVGRKNTALHKKFDMYIKKKPDNEQLKTVDELLNDMQNERKRGKKNKTYISSTSRYFF